VRPAPQLLVNLSNHPSADWSDAQKKAALKLAPNIRDLTFPAVSPEADTEEINALADELVERLRTEMPGATHAMVQGEFTLAHALVRRLQQTGVVCVAATTRRRSSSSPAAPERRGSTSSDSENMGDMRIACTKEPSYPRRCVEQTILELGDLLDQHPIRLVNFDFPPHPRQHFRQELRP
jgi:hypothetical protein